MPELGALACRVGSSGRTDALVAAGLAVGILGYGALGRGDWSIPILVLLCCAALATRRRWPFAASVALTVGLVLVWASGQEHAVTGPMNLLLAVPPLVAYTLGTNAGLRTGLAGATLLALGLQLGGPFNPLLEMITFGPLLAGRVVRSRRELTRQIEIRNQELDEEREHFALESVRYERARIARELHDIVAHSISVVVVQAAAGQRYAAESPDRAPDALDAIASAAREARAEIDLLNHELDTPRSHGHERIGELARRTAATGLPVRYRPSGDLDKLRKPAADVAYRVVQESLTNAIKHAPGAAIEITVRARNEHFEIEVTSAAPQVAPSGLEHTGAGRGLPGMHDRVTACGGTLTTGPTSTGGWRVTARLPSAAQELEETSAISRDAAV
jgi:signal transduction histidine kinase